MVPTKAVKPNTKPILAMLDPTTLFIAIAGEPVKAACKLTSNSGTDVAKDTTVIPMTILEILNLKEIATEDLTKNSPPTTNRINPKITKTILIKILLCEDTISNFFFIIKFHIY